MQTLTYAEVKARCRDAYCRKQLSAQGVSRFERRCCYETPEGRHCAIGVALTKQTLNEIHGLGRNEKRVHSLINAGLVEIKDMKDRINLYNLQEAHDNWVQARNGYNNEALARIAEAKFMGLIYS